MDLDRYDDVVSGIYAAALRPALLPDVIASVAGLCQASRALLYSVGDGSGGSPLAFGHNLSAGVLAQFCGRYIAEDPFARAAAANGSDLVPDEQLLQTAFYRALWAPLAIRQMVSGVVFDGTDAHKQATFVSLYRRGDEPLLDTNDLTLFRRLVAHLSRALGVMYHLRDAEARVASSRAAMNLLPASILLLDARAGVQFCNRAAESLLRDVRSPLRLQRRGFGRQTLSLASPGSAADDALQRAIRLALQPLSADVEAHFSEALIIPDPSGGPRCVVHVAPLSVEPGSPLSADARGAIVLAYDLARAERVSEYLLRQTFGLTRAEAHTARQVLSVGTVAQIAARRGISVNTAKTHLKRVYDKTGARRNVDLLKLLLALSTEG